MTSISKPVVVQNHYPFHLKAMVADYVYPVFQVMEAEYQEYVLRIL